MKKNKNYIKRIFLIIFIIFISLNILKSTGRVYADDLKVEGNSGQSETSDTNDTEGDFLDGTIGVILMAAKIGIVAIGRVISLILGLFAKEGASLSVQDIIFNKVEVTDINFFDIDGAEGTIQTIRKNVAAWYVGVRNLAAVVLVIILIYVGIRMAISTIAEEKAKYKKMLIDWFTSMCLLFVLHYIIILTIQLNNTLVNAIGDASSTGDIGKQFLNDALNNAYFTKGMANAICYLLLEALTFGFLIAYIKRMITIAFLIIIAPLVTITYSIDKMGDGSSQALNAWFKEFAYNILIQPFHCVAFLALCSTAVNLGEKANLSDGVLAICLLTFLAKSAENIVKKIFGFQAESMASPVAAAALGFTLAKNTANFAEKIGKGASNKAPKIPNDGGSNAGVTPPTRASQNNMQQSNNQPQKSTTKSAPKSTTKSAPKSTTKSAPKSTTKSAPKSTTKSTKKSTKNNRQQIKQRKLSGQGLGGKILRGAVKTAVNANKYAFTMGAGLALGASKGELNEGTALGFEIGQGWASRTREQISGKHYRANTARAFNNYKAKTGMSDDEILDRAMGLLKGNIESENDADRELKNTVIDMANYYRSTGSDEDESFKKTNQVLDDIISGAQGEETKVSSFTGHVKEQYYKRQAKSYREKSRDTEHYSIQERREFQRKAAEAKQYVEDKKARERFVNRKQ